MVRMVERRPFAFWQRDGHFLLIDREGEVVASENIGAFGRAAAGRRRRRPAPPRRWWT